MELLPYIPADPDFLKTLDAAYTHQRRVYQQNRRAVHAFSDAAATIAAESFTPDAATTEADDEREIFSPEQMDFYHGEIATAWQKYRSQIAAARTAREQMDGLGDLLRDAFRGACYTGNRPLMPRFFDQLVMELGETYEAHALAATAPESGANITRIGQDAKEFIAEKLGTFCDYTDLTLDALTDIVHLTQAHEAAIGNRGDAAASTPHDVIFRRYCKMHKIDNADDFGMVPEADREAFIARIVSFYTDELFAPFNPVLPDKVSLELAWFMGAAIEAIRHDDRIRQNASARSRFIGMGHSPALRIANDNEPENPSGFAAAEMERRDTTPRLAPERTVLEILQDPKAMERMHAMLAETFDDFPDAATSPEQLVDAKNYFHQMFLQGEHAARELSPVR